MSCRVWYAARMRQALSETLARIDIPLLVGACVLSGAGIITLLSFTGNSLFTRQLLWFAAALVVFVLALFVRPSVFFRTPVLVLFYLFGICLLILVLFLGREVLGAHNRFDFGIFSFQPSDLTQLFLVAMLAKYFAKRHVDIRAFRHIVVSGVYAFIYFALLFLEPDFGAASIIFFTWVGIILVSGASKKHLALIVLVVSLIGGLLWTFGLQEYQKARVRTFLNPAADIRGAGYNAFQSMVAVGSGGLWGKGIGYGTQSKLSFLPEYETDFIFAAFTEEWGFVGAAAILTLFAFVFLRMIALSRFGATNTERLFGLGIVVLFLTHTAIHIGMNVGLLPVTGVTLPFMSYGGSHLVTEFFALGLLMSMRRIGTPKKTEELFL